MLGSPGCLVTTAVQIDHNADGSTVSLLPGQSLIIRLPENPTTGYRWAVAVSGGMTLVSDDFSPTGAGVGAGGTRTLEWTSPALGSQRITLALRRPWEAAEAAIRRFTVTIDRAIP